MPAYTHVLMAATRLTAAIRDCVSRKCAGPVRTEIVKAFVVVAPGATADDDLARDIQAHVKSQLAAHEYPREVEFVAEMPLTSTGKIMRRVLRAREIERRAGDG